MPITSVERDTDALALTIVADFPVPVRRLWDAYADPRQLEKFWGPEEWPATFTRHDMTVGGRSDYYMTGPEGERSAGYWEFTAVDEGRSFEVRDGFASDDGTPNADMPSMTMLFEFSASGEGSRVVTTTRFGSLEHLEQLLGMGMEEGMRSAMSQIDRVVEDLASFAAGQGTELQILSDTRVRVSRIIRGSVEQVWRAHHDPEIMQRWLLGPDGWRMSECTISSGVGDPYRYAWEPIDGSEGAFAFIGVTLEAEPPRREVSTELMEGMPGAGTRNELSLRPVEGGTLLSLVIIYPDVETRDMILATGMVDGMESSYARLETEVMGVGV